MNLRHSGLKGGKRARRLFNHRVVWLSCSQADVQRKGSPRLPLFLIQPTCSTLILLDMFGYRVLHARSDREFP